MQTRRTVLKGISAAVAALSCPLAIAHPARASVPQVSWEVPGQARIKELVRLKTAPADAWKHRIFGLVDVAWPAMALLAQNGRQVVDEEVCTQVIPIEGLIAFKRKHPKTREGLAVAAYLRDLPAYLEGSPLLETTRLHHGFVEMSIWAALDDARSA